MISIYDYHSAPTSPTVAMPKAEAKPPAYAKRLQDLIAEGHMPISAMHILEGRDHRRALPQLASSGIGGKGISRHAPMREAILATLTSEWQQITPEMEREFASTRHAISHHLKELVAVGKAECKRGNHVKPNMWRLA